MAFENDEHLTELIHGAKEVGLCVCHIQSDCPTHPKGDFGAMTDTEINKACAKLMGKCWHEFVGLCRGRLRESTSGCCCEGIACKSCKIRVSSAPPNFKPLNSKSDWADLVFFCVNEWGTEKWDDFLLWYLTGWGKVTAQCIPSSYRGLKKLLKDQRALPTSLALYEKEKEDDSNK